MPEGPEIRVTTDQLAPELVGRRLVNMVSHPGARLKGLPMNWPGQYLVTRVFCHGKKLFWVLDQPSEENGQPVGQLVFMFSLLMTGRFQWTEGQYARLAFHFSGPEATGPEAGTEALTVLYYQDFRTIGSLDIFPLSELDQRLKNLGPDLLQQALTTWIPSHEWTKLFNTKTGKVGTRTICQVLLDQSKVAGIGNYLKSDILYRCRIHPHRRVADLTSQEWEMLRVVSHQTILESYHHGGLTIEFYLPPNGQRGMYPTMVYDKAGQFDENGYVIQYMKTKDGRGSYWVPELQM